VGEPKKGAAFFKLSMPTTVEGAESDRIEALTLFFFRGKNLYFVLNN